MDFLLNFILHIDQYMAMIVRDYHAWTYAILFIIIFCETGLVVTPFLPGDSLLFVAGAISALPDMPISIHILVIILFAAAILGDSCNYMIGHFFGRRLFNNPKSKIFKQSHLEKTHEFYKKYGGKTIILARFIPIVRTFAPFVAGMGKMNYYYFMVYNLVGGAVWVTIFCYAGYNLFHIYTEYKKGTDEYNSITQMAVTERDPDGEAAGPEAGSELKAPMDIDFASLKSVNDDVVGWIYVEAVPDINYPIVHGKDNETYLHRTYEKNYNFAGTIFVDYENKGDFSDCNTIVYGHNMKNGSMFAQLKKFTQDEETYKKSKYFWIFTPEKNYRYEIISAYTTGVNSDTYTLFKGPGEEFEKYLEKIRGYSEIRTDAEGMNIKDKIITLSTCTGNEATRYVVQGKRVDTLDVGQ